MKVGISGTGKMGSAIATRLLASGLDVIVWNRTPAKTKPLVEAGATGAQSPAELAAKSDVIITILTDANAIDSVYSGANGILSADVNGKLVIEMSTVRPETEKALAERVTARGAGFVECPVGGTTGPAKEGKLFGFIGGADAEVARARPVLEKLCRRLEHVGPVGAGASMKLAINLPLVVFWQAFGEALALCRELGVDPQRMADMFGDSSGGTNALKNRLGPVAQALGGQEVPGTYDVDSMRKDMRTMLEHARARGVELPVTAAALACYDEGASAGIGTMDGANQSAYWRNRKS